MKMANMDRVYNWLLSKEDATSLEKKNPIKNIDIKNIHSSRAKTGQNIDRESKIFYFADVCAGPGGFTEYMLWRKGFYNAKGFGFTLKGYFIARRYVNIKFV